MNVSIMSCARADTASRAPPRRYISLIAVLLLAGTGESPLLQLYCTLVAIELTLKDSSSGNSDTHDVIRLSKALNGGPAVDVAADSVNITLKILACTSRRGVASVVNPQKYPDVRYLRLDTDFAGGSTNRCLQDARDAASTRRA